MWLFRNQLFFKFLNMETDSDPAHPHFLGCHFVAPSEFVEESPRSFQPRRAGRVPGKAERGNPSPAPLWDRPLGEAGKLSENGKTFDHA
jgi:hypothetical protein